MNRFFLTDSCLTPGELVDLSPLAHQLRAVLRMAPGDEILLLDDSGWAFPTRIDDLTRSRAAGSVLGREFVETEPPARLTLYQCGLKGERFEWVLQKGTELGVTRFVPVISSRTVVRPAPKLLRKYDRWRGIIREAAEQSGRGRLPELADPLDWQAAVATAQGVRLLPWEEARRAAPGIDSALAAAALPEPVCLLIGPEGGISQEEADAALACGWQAVSLGPRVLRAETGAVVGVALVLQALGALG